MNEAEAATVSEPALHLKTSLLATLMGCTDVTDVACVVLRSDLWILLASSILCVVLPWDQVDMRPCLVDWCGIIPGTAGTVALHCEVLGVRSAW